MVVEGPGSGTNDESALEFSSSPSPTLPRSFSPSSTRVSVGGSNVGVVVEGVDQNPYYINNILDISEGTQEAILAAGDDLRSSVVNIKLVDANGNSVQPESSISICLDSQSSNQDDLCLGSFNEDTGEWQCDDNCLEEDSDGQFCGDVDHLTNFALLLSGGNGGGSGCGSSVNGYILGSAFNDFMLILATTATCCCISLCVIVLLSVGKGKRKLLGLEGTRVRQLRVVEHS